MKLFTEMNVGPMKLKNRLAMAPMATHYAAPDGSVTERLTTYYVERAKGGAGLIILESCYVNPLGRGGIRRLGIHKDSLIDGLSRLTEQIHGHGAKITCELHHGGPQVPRHVIGEMPVSASNRHFQAGLLPPPRTLSKTEIRDVARDYAQGVRRAREAGFDAALIHAGHGYLINSFLSPVTNRRTDEYGGSPENRMRFILEIIEAMRQQAGDDFPIMVRMNSKDFVDGGSELEDSIVLAKRLEAATVDCIHVTGGVHLAMEMMVQPMIIPRGCLVPYAAEIKKAVNIPVAVVGRINNVALAEQILADGHGDLITMGRALIADPYLPKKALEGRVADIRPCIACNQGCNHRLHLGEDVTCFGNPQVGKEAEWTLESVANPKKVLVIGGGPAGMEAAFIASSRGHRVVLYEQNSRLGGQLYAAAKPPHKEEIENILRYMSDQLVKNQVEIHLNTKLAFEDIRAIKPEAVIVATGSKAMIPPIEGVHMNHVVTAQDILLDPAPVSGRVAVIGGGATGLETAELLSEKGFGVTVVEMMPELALDLESSRKKLILNQLSANGVRILIGAKVKKITSDGLIIDRDGAESFVEADSVVMAAGVVPIQDFNETLKSYEGDVYFAGNCHGPGAGIDAIREGFMAGRAV
jgi:2,4-dienoyl-CoA reductase-like NADH-dependent reductase (Old Yellow Enzyme family)/thioredoxin reductase